MPVYLVENVLPGTLKTLSATTKRRMKQNSSFGFDGSKADKHG